MAGMDLFDDLEPTKPSWSTYVNTHEYGYTRIHASATALSMHFIANADSVVRDSFTLTKAVS